MNASYHIISRDLVFSQIVAFEQIGSGRGSEGEGYSVINKDNLFSERSDDVRLIYKQCDGWVSLGLTALRGALRPRHPPLEVE